MRLGKHRTSVLLRNKLLSKNWKMGIFDHIKFLSITGKNKISIRKKNLCGMKNAGNKIL